MKIPRPLDRIDEWLTQFLNPRVVSVETSTKQATNFSSAGLSIVLQPHINPYFEDQLEVTLGNLPDTMLAKLIETYPEKVLSKFFTYQEIQEDVPAEEKTLKYPVVKYMVYPNQKIRFDFQTFCIFPVPFLMEQYQTAGSFLYYKAKFLEYELLPANFPPSEVRLLEQQYLDFLVRLLLASTEIDVKSLMEQPKKSPTRKRSEK